ncbi:molybdopterin-containing oxidoreductase family protein [Desulfosediminicola ganghwensis]|uniref:molybdopterin-containing oxidoreductase family protein n=1 Tax=Desulfosediminicola ganghwensis TaxID=2569540 RepID=UPI0010ACEEB8|nr:molybdopterin-dependent oxidoreductase [Desulfosediminicola ganghwensis]
MQSENVNMVELKKTVCPLDCPDSCGMVAKVENGVITSLNGDPDHPYTNGFLCRKMRSYHQRVYSEDRILHPQVRVGKKGQGQFARISWDEALTLLADKLSHVRDTYGGEAILPYQYAGNMGHLNCNAGHALYHKLGTSRIIETICSAAAGAGWSMHLDKVPGSPPEVAEDSKLIVAWGINVKVTNVHFWQYISKARANGSKLLVIDPYRNETAQSADEYLQVLPGGDGALALGAIKSLLERDLLDQQMIDEQTTDFEQLAAYLQATPWQEFCEQSGLPQQEIERIATLLQDNPATFIRIGIGLSRNSRGGMSVRAITALAAALGLLSGQPGQGLLYSSKAFSGDSARVRFPELLEKPTRFINMAHLGHALTTLKDPIRLFMVYSCNPLSVAPDGSMVRQGLLREDLFTVVHEQVMTPTARYADLLLPATTFLENRDLYTGYGHFQLGVVNPVVPALGEAKSNFQLFQELAQKLRFTDEAFLQSEEDRLASYIATIEGLPADFSYQREKFSGWITSTRRRLGESVKECWNYSYRFAAAGEPGIPSIPCVLKAAEFADKDLCSRFPFALITPPHMDLLNSTFGERYPGKNGEVLIHPEDAAEYDIKEGDCVRLSNFRGKAERVAVVTDATQRGLLVAPGIFWQTDSSGTGINDLTSQKVTDIGEGPTFHESRVQIEIM